MIFSTSHPFISYGKAKRGVEVGKRGHYFYSWILWGIIILGNRGYKMNEEGSLEEMKEIINSNGYKLANYCDQYFNPANNLSINSIKKLYFNTFCYFCGNKDIHLHHIIPRCKGGIDEKENLIPLCKKHHKLIHNKSHFLHFKEGFYYLKEQKTNKKKGKPCKEQFVLCRDPPHKSIEISLYFKKFNSRQENVE